MPDPDRPTRVRYIVLFGLCLAAGLAYIHRGCLGIVESRVRADLSITKEDMGLVMAAFFWSYALFQIPTGLLSDRWGPRRALLLFGLLGALTVALTAIAGYAPTSMGLMILLISRALMGIAQAGLFPASTRAIATWFPVSRRGSASGTLQACMSVGSAAGAFMTARLVGVTDWPIIFLVYSIPGIAWSLWFFGWFRDRPAEHPGPNQAEIDLVAGNGHAHSGQRESLLSVARDWHVQLLCGQQFCRAAANVFWLTWCPTYLREVHSLDLQSAGSLTSLPILGVVVGSLGGGALADWVFSRTQNRRLSRSGVAVVTTLLGVLVFLLVYRVPAGNVALAMTLIVIASALASGGNPCAYSAAIDLGGRNLAVVFGAMNMSGNFGAALFSQAVPAWVDQFGWSAVVLLVGGLYAVGALVWLPLNPNRTPRVPRGNS